MRQFDIPDPPWMGLSQDDYEAKYRRHWEDEEEYEEYLADEISERYKEIRDDIRGTKN